MSELPLPPAPPAPPSPAPPTPPAVPTVTPDMMSRMQASVTSSVISSLAPLVQVRPPLDHL
eukprot:3906903-Pyramimonas_sp.AAC.1